MAFGEALVPGYPFWLELTGGARFNSALQKTIFAEYASQAVQPEAGHLDQFRAASARNGIAIYLGCVERAADRGGHSLYCSLVFINQRGEIGSIHRKLMPTYEERLVWSAGDGHGLRTHRGGAFHAGGLNCWENWMPLPRSALYAQGEDPHVAVWPGGIHNTRDITDLSRWNRGRMLHLFPDSCGGRISVDLPPGARPSPRPALQYWLAAGRVSRGRDGEWLLAPSGPEEKLFVAVIDLRRVLEERQNFDPSGHYARPDVDAP